MQLAQSEFGIFLNGDATPQGSNWLRQLVENLQDPGVAAVYGRQIPRPDCQAVYAADYERCFGPALPGIARPEGHAPTIPRWDHFFSMVSSGIRKDIWSQRGFLEKYQYSEDDEYTRWCRSRGYQIVYCPDSVVMHSHNYTPEQAYRRIYGEAFALAGVWENSPARFNWPRTVLAGWLNDARRDLVFCHRHARWQEWPHALRIRWRQRTARLRGFKEGWTYYRVKQKTEAPVPAFVTACRSN
jgi:rhamnosyltransferase